MFIHNIWTHEDLLIVKLNIKYTNLKLNVGIPTIINININLI